MYLNLPNPYVSIMISFHQYKPILYHIDLKSRSSENFFFIYTIIKASNNGSIWRQCGEEVNLEGLPRGEINRKAISGPSEEPMFHEANEAHLPETKLGWEKGKTEIRPSAFGESGQDDQWVLFLLASPQKRKKYLWRIPIDIINTIATITSVWYEVSWPVRIV